MLINHYGMPSVVALRTRTAPISAVQGTGLPFAGLAALAVAAVVVNDAVDATPGSPSRGAPV